MSPRHAPSVIRAGIALFLPVFVLSFSPIYSIAAGSLERFDRIVSDRLGIQRHTLQSIVPSADGNARTLRVLVDGKAVTLRLWPASDRAPGFQVLVQEAGGSLRSVEPPAPETWRGVIDGTPGSIAAATIHDGRVHAIFQLPGGSDYFVEPVSVLDSSADPDLHVVYRGEDVTAASGTCPVVPREGEARSRLGPDALLADTLHADTLHAEIAFDADYEFYTLNGASVDATVLDIEKISFALNAVYERDCAIQHRVTAIIVRSTPSDPYTTSSSDSLLREFRNHWNAAHTGISRDLAHLMTGKNLNGSTIGIAYLGVVCDRTRAYGVSQSRFVSSPFSRRVSLTAHEMGHNWDAEHCDQEPDVADPCNIMCSSLGGCNGTGAPNFEPQGAAVIRAFAVSRSCLTTAPVSVGLPVAVSSIRLDAPHPSPTSNSTRIDYSLAAAGAVRLTVHDVSGRRRALLVDRIDGAGQHSVAWDGRDDGGVRLAPGVWYVRLEASGISRSRRLVLIP